MHMFSLTREICTYVLYKRQYLKGMCYFKVTACVCFVSFTFPGSLSLRSHFDSFSPSSSLSNELVTFCVQSSVLFRCTANQYEATLAVNMFIILYSWMLLIYHWRNKIQIYKDR